MTFPLVRSLRTSRPRQADSAIKMILTVTSLFFLVFATGISTVVYAGQVTPRVSVVRIVAPKIKGNTGAEIKSQKSQRNAAMAAENAKLKAAAEDAKDQAQLAKDQKADASNQFFTTVPYNTIIPRAKVSP